MGVHMDSPTVFETPTCTELCAEPLVGLLVEDKAEILAALANTTQLLAPAPWFDRVIPQAESEPGLSIPCTSRRGRVQKLEEAIVLHFCAECGAWGTFGYGVNFRGGRQGRWYCAAHRPGGKFSSAQPVEGVRND